MSIPYSTLEVRVGQIIQSIVAHQEHPIDKSSLMHDLKSMLRDMKQYDVIDIPEFNDVATHDEPVHTINIINSFNNNTINRPVNKMDKINSNMKRIQDASIPFEQCNLYHIKAQNVYGEVYNFYLTSEKYHRNGYPTEGQGINEFITLMLQHN